MRCRLLQEMEITESVASPETLAQGVRRGSLLFAPAGTIIEDPQAWLLVKNLDAEPADAECEEASRRSPDELAAALIGKARLEAAIQPEDFAAFDAGEMIGYDSAGRAVPGPNAKPQAIDEDEEE